MSDHSSHDVVSFEQIDSLQRAFDDSSKARLAQNAVTQTSVEEVALNRRIVTTTPFSFSTQLDRWKVTNQKASGRCWMFAALNLLRVGAMEKMNLDDFEFSQNYTLFWDKFERSNYFFEEILARREEPVADRTNAFMLADPLGDGGQWNMAVNIIRKHGLVPKEQMPETQSSSSTRWMNRLLTYKLREGAKDLREVCASNGIEAARRRKRERLAEIWRILCIHLGSPPATIDWQYVDKDRKFHRHGTMTPQQFAAEFVTLPIDDYVCLVHDPRPEHPTNQTYTVDCLGNVVGGQEVVYLNIDIDQMKDITQRLLERGEPVWFGCDVGQQMKRDMGIWDAKLYDLENLYDAEWTMDKATRLSFQDTRMTHAMLFTGVDVVDGQARRWRVENSWGEENGRKGFFTMNDNWFDEYMFEIAAPRELLNDELKTALAKDPIRLPAWDPMGALAK